MHYYHFSDYLEYASRVAVAQKQAALCAFVSGSFSPHQKFLRVYLFQIDDLICESESLVREGLAVIVKKEMIEAYKEIW
jgi:hypothetical protein